MSEVVIFENPGNKAARLERENVQLRAENRRLRQALGEAQGEEIASQVVSQAPALPQQQTFQSGACTVTIGRKAGRQATAIPSLEQQQQQSGTAGSQVQIYNAKGDNEIDNNAAPVVQAKTIPVARRMQPGGLPGGGGGAVFDLAGLKPVPVKPAKLDDSEQRFSMMELDQQQQQGGKGG